MSKYPGRIVTDLAPAGYSVFFDGAADGLVVGNNSNLDLSTGDFTVECWFYATSVATARPIMNRFAGNATSRSDLQYAIALSTSSNLVMAPYQGNVNYDITFTGVALNQWNHCALVRTGNLVYGFLNGVRNSTSHSISGALNTGSWSSYVGSYTEGGVTTTFLGNISNVRIVKGTALYTGATYNVPTQLLNITNTQLLTCNSPVIIDQSNNNFPITVASDTKVSTLTPFAAYVPYNPALGASTPGIWTVDEAMQAAATRQWNMYDPSFNLTTMLLHGNGTNGAQNNTFLDSSSNNFTITRNGNTTQGSFSPFSQTGWSVNYGANNYWQAPASTNWDIFGGAFTVEMWVYLTGFTGDVNQGVFMIGNYTGGGGGSGWSIGSSSGASPVFNVGYWNGGPGTTINSSGIIPLNAWTHLAVTRSGSTIFFYINGVSVGTAAAPSIAAGDKLTSGAYTQNFSYPSWVYGSISNIRIIKGTALYSGTGSFAPPTGPLTAVANTVFLGNQNNRFVDNGPNTVTITTFGAPSIQSFSPFLPVAAYTPQTIGGSGFFDGNGDYLTGNGVLVTTTTANTFSCEGWFYPTTFANLIWLVGDMDATGGTNNVAVDISTGGAVELYWWDGAAKRCTSTSVMRLNQWNYFAVVVNAGAISIYVNSTTAGQSGTTTLTNRSAASQNFSVGAFNNSTTPNGYISNLRWSTSARTISSIPTAPYTSDGNTRLLLNFTNAGVVDSTGKNVLETVGNAQISTTQSKFGGSSIAFDGTGDYLLPNSATTDLLAFGSGDFTVEMWIYQLASGTFALCDARPNNTNGAYFNLSSTSGQLEVYVNSSSLILAGTIPLNTWTHLAVTRAGTNLRGFINGLQVGSTVTNSTVFLGSAQRPVIGASGFNVTQFNFNGYIDELRVTKGFARYTAAFTPQTSQWQDQ